MLDLDRLRGAGLHVRVNRFGPDGWEDGDRTWFAETDRMKTPQTLDQFLTAELRLPRDEATALAQDVLGPWMREWESRGGEDEATRVDRFSAVLMTSVAALFVLACVAIGLLIWLVAT